MLCSLHLYKTRFWLSTSSFRKRPDKRDVSVSHRLFSLLIGRGGKDVGKTVEVFQYLRVFVICLPAPPSVGTGAGRQGIWHLGFLDMGNLEFSFFNIVTSIFQPIGVILIWKILPKERTSALGSKQTSL